MEYWVSPDRDAKTSVVYDDSDGMAELVDCFCASDESLDSDAIRVIEKSAYQKAVDALKKISYIGFDCIHCEMKNGVVCEEHLFDNARIATEALKELGEL